VNMSGACKQLVESYIRWLRGNFAVAEVNGACEITTPFLDRHNDQLQIYVRREDKGLLLSDDAYMISDLRLSGCSLDTPKRRELLQSILGGFGVRLENDELIVKCREQDFPQKKHALLQAMLAINDLFATAQPHVTSLFLEDVAAFLQYAGVRFIMGVDFVGRSGFHHKFDFAIPPSPNAPERLVRAVNHPNRDSATSVIFAWNDIREVRDKAAQMYAILNDSEHSVSAEVEDAFKEYNVKPVRWSERQQYQHELAA
jgi:hypothetical protein